MNLATSKTVFGVAREAKTNGQAISVNVGGEMIEAGKDTGLAAGAGAGTSRIIATDITQDDADPDLQCRLIRVEWPDGSEHVVGTCDENGHLAVQPRASRDTSAQYVFNVKSYGAVADWNGITGTDNLAAFQATIAAMETYASNNAKKLCTMVASGAYYLSDTLEFDRALIFEGAGRSEPYDLQAGVGAASSTYPGTYLVWPSGTTGLRFLSQVGGVLDTQYSIVRNMTLTTTGYTLDVGEGFANTVPSTGYGIEVHARIVLENLRIGYFGSHGVFVQATSDDPGAIAGNASESMFTQVISNSNGGDGFRFEGYDANICAMIACDASGNTEWGFNDQSIGGSTFVGCHCEGNRGGYVPGQVSSDGFNHDYKNSTSGTCRSAFFGCYSEFALNDLYAPATVVGGNLCGTGLTPTSDVTEM